jgi:hypothetical protein
LAANSRKKPQSRGKAWENSQKLLFRGRKKGAQCPNRHLPKVFPMKLSETSARRVALPKRKAEAIFFDDDIGWKVVVSRPGTLIYAQ